MNNTKYRRLICWLIYCAPLAIYFVKFYHQEIGADLLMRLTEAKYFRIQINPYDVFHGVKPAIGAYGNQLAAYSFFSYIFAGLLNKVSNSSQVAILIFICIDFVALIGGVVLTNKIRSRTMDQYFGYKIEIEHNENNIRINLLFMLVLMCSPYFWQHIYFLNYTVLSIFGLLLLIYSLMRGWTPLALCGMFLIGLRPSLAIPVFIYLFFAKRWKILVLSILSYLGILILASWWLHENPIRMIRQLIAIQGHFSNNLGYYHADGFLLALKSILGSYTTLASVIISCLVVAYYRNYLSNPIISLFLIIAVSTSLFYTQVHAWIGIFPMLLIAITNISRSDRTSMIIVSLLIIFLIAPRLTGYVNEEFRYQYTVIHNMLRFGALWFATVLAINKMKFASIKSLSLNASHNAH